MSKISARLRTGLTRLRAFFSNRKLDEEFDQEVRSHLDLLEEENIRRGIPPEEAHYAALRSFGSVTQAKEVNRERRGLRHVENLLQDLRYAARLMRKNRGFTTVAVLTLALGIGANTAMFSVVNAVILRSLPYSHPERIAYFLVGDATHGGFDDHVSLGDFADWKRLNDVFDQLSAFQGASMVLAGDGVEPQLMDSNLITANFLPILGWHLSMGRNFLPEEELPGHNAVAILSDQCWHRSFGGDSAILGRKIRLNSQPFTIVGILSPGLRFLERDVYSPLVLTNFAENRKIIERAHALGHLRRGITLAQAQTQMQAIARQLQAEYPVTNQYRSIQLQSFKEQQSQLNPTPRRMHQSLLVLLGAVGLITLMACSNVASLLLARGLKRQKEFVMRVALGASRRRIASQLLVESVLLFVTGGVAGYGLAVWSRDLMVKAAASYLEGKPVELSAGIFLFSFGVSLMTGLIFGLFPALQAIKVRPNDALQTSLVSSGRRKNRARNSLIVFEISLAMVMLIAFGLLSRSFSNVMSADQGFDRTNLLTTAVGLDQSKYATPQQQATFSRNLVDKVRELPGVQSAGVASSIPLMGGGAVDFSAQQEGTGASPVQGIVRRLEVSPGYFEALRIRFLEGRPFTDYDSGTAPAVAIVNETLVHRYFSGTNPLGRRVRVGDPQAPWREIVGVIADVHQRNMDEDVAPIVYSPWYQSPDSSLSLIVRTAAAADMQAVSAELRPQIRSLDLDQAWQPIQTMQQVIDDSESVSLRRPIVLLLGTLGSLALVLALIGMYGVLSYMVSERTREIGIRVALGAMPRNVARVVLRETLTLLLLGLSCGFILALAWTRLLPTGPIGWSGAAIHLYGVSRIDAFTYSSVTLLLTLVALLASYVPARRATRIDPMVALRYE